MSRFEIKAPYEPAIGDDNKDCIVGPGTGFGIYAGDIFPHLSCNSVEEARRAAIMCNLAFQEGYKQCQRDFQSLLGISGK